MEYENLLSKTRANQERLFKAVQLETLRPFFNQIDTSSRGTLLIGPRGTGKTTFLLSEAMKGSDSLYLSLDNLLYQNLSIYDLIEAAYHDGCRRVFFDEVHFRKSWAIEIKNLYDTFPKLKITLSDSSSLVLREAIADLSRRFPKSQMSLLSFREFLFLKMNQSLPIFNPIAELQKGKEVSLPSEIIAFCNKNNINKLFHEFLKEGQRPFFLEGRYQERILNIIDKTIFSDIPFFAPNIQKSHLNTVRSILSYLSDSAIPTVNIQSLCAQWEIGKDKVYELLRILEATGMIQIVYNTKTPKGSSKGDKIFFQDCSFYYSLKGQLGNVREAYFTSALRSAGHIVLSSKNEEECDFVVGDLKFEIGGANKKRKKSDIVVKDPLDDLYASEWPLWCFGFMW